MKLFSKLLFSLALLVPQVKTVSAGGDTYTETTGGREVPSVYAVHQQQGPVCPYLPWVNLEKVRAMRERDQGEIVFSDEDFAPKLHSYAYFLLRIRVLDNMYESLRGEDCDYAVYERALREEGIKSTQRFNKSGHFVDKIDWNPLNQARRSFASPYNLEVIENPHEGLIRWLPILQKPETSDLYFLDYESNKTVLIPEVDNNDQANIRWYVYNGDALDNKAFKIEDWMLTKMGITIEECRLAAPARNFLGFNTGYVMLSSTNAKYNKEHFYDAGTYQHMLFACGLNADNTPFEDKDDSLEAKAYRNFHKVMTSDILNPWATVSKEDFFEYHLANIFKHNPELKAKAVASVDFYNNFWQLYKESFDLYDSPNLPRTKLSEKQRFMPGEDQMLAYFFSHQLRFVWASSISFDALISVEELEEELGKGFLKAMKLGSFLPGVPSEKKIIAEAEEKKFGPRKGKYSFLDVWTQVKEVLLGDIPDRDLVTFSSHGSVISFDDNLVTMQSHESPGIANQLGFEMWDSTYDKGLKPFYRKPGKKTDQIEFER